MSGVKWSKVALLQKTSSRPQGMLINTFTVPDPGIGLLSKLPITKSTVQTLTYHTGPDTNHRVVLHADIQVADFVVHVAVLHLSYDRLQQCANVAEVLKYLHGKISPR